MIPSPHNACFAVALFVTGACADEMTKGTESEIQVLRVSVQTPNPCWTIQIKGVYSAEQELFVVSELVPPAADDTCIQMVGQVEDEVSLKAPPYRVKHLILGRSWDMRRDSSGWGPEADYVYLRSNAELSRMLRGAHAVPKMDKPAKDAPPDAEQQTSLSR